MATTRLGQFGVGVEPYAGFAPKTTQLKSSERVTRLGQFGVGLELYSTFEPKTPAVVEEPVVVVAVPGGGGDRKLPKRRRTIRIKRRDGSVVELPYEEAFKPPPPLEELGLPPVAPPQPEQISPFHALPDWALQRIKPKPLEELGLPPLQPPIEPEPFEQLPTWLDAELDDGIDVRDALALLEHLPDPAVERIHAIAGDAQDMRDIADLLGMIGSNPIAEAAQMREAQDLADIEAIFSHL